MLEKVVERFLKLFCIKSIVTIILTILFYVLAYRGTIGSEEVMTIFTVVIAFYFGTQAAKKE